MCPWLSGDTLTRINVLQKQRFRPTGWARFENRNTRWPLVIISEKVEIGKTMSEVRNHLNLGQLNTVYALPIA